VQRGMTETVPLLLGERWERRQLNTSGGETHQIIWLREGKSETDECLSFNCCIQLLIDHITNGGEERCGCNLEMMWHNGMCT
jgi:hypothetical protein